MEGKKIVAMEGQLQEHIEKMQRTKAEREKLECANGEITKNVSLRSVCLCHFHLLQCFICLDIILISVVTTIVATHDNSTTFNTVNSHPRRKSSIVPRRNARLTQMNGT